MKYMIEYTVRTAGLSHDQNFAGSQALLNAFGKWKPEDGLTVNAFVSTWQVTEVTFWSKPATPRPSSHSSQSTPFGTTPMLSRWSISARRYRSIRLPLLGRRARRRAKRDWPSGRLIGSNQRGRREAAFFGLGVHDVSSWHVMARTGPNGAGLMMSVTLGNTGSGPTGPIW